MLVMAVLLGVVLALVAQLRIRACDVAGDAVARNTTRLVASGATSRVIEDYFANLAGNCEMIPSLSMSAMCRIWTWTSS